MIIFSEVNTSTWFIKTRLTATAGSVKGPTHETEIFIGLHKM